MPYPATRQTHWVKPTSCATNGERDSRRHVHLVDGNDIVLYYPVTQCLVYPEEIDSERFCKALSKALAIYPTFAGRLRKPKGAGEDWQIHFESSGLPVDVVEEKDRGHVADLGRQHSAVQASFHNFVAPLPFLEAANGEDAPLAVFRLTKLVKTGQTVLGCNFNHILGDGHTIWAFIQTLSEIYQGIEPKRAPTFHKRRWPEPPKGVEGEVLYKKYFLPGLTSYASEDLLNQWQDTLSRCSLLELVFTPSEIEGLFKQATSSLLEEGLRVTHQDVLTAYLISLYNRVMDVPVTTLRTIVNYRTREVDETCLWRHPNNAGNCFVWATVRIPATSSLQEIALTIRKGILQIRDQSYTETILSLMSASNLESVKTGRINNPLGPGVLVVNGLLRVNMADMASFGYQGRVQSYTEGCYPGEAAIHRANPVLRADGTWEDSAGKAIVSLPIPTELVAQMYLLKDEDMTGFGISERCDLPLSSPRL